MTWMDEVQQQLQRLQEQILEQAESSKKQRESFKIQREERIRSNAEFKEFMKEVFTGMNVQLMQLASLVRDYVNHGEGDIIQYCPENQPLIDAPQVFEESPKPNTYTKSTEWDGNGQENAQEGFEVVSSRQLDGFHTNRGTSNAQQETKIAVQEENLKLTLQAYGVAVDVGCSGEKAGDICSTAVHQNERHQGRAPEYLAMKESLLDVVRKSCPSGTAIASICHRLVFDPGGKMVSRLGSVRGALIQEGQDPVTYALINAIAVREILKKYDKVHYSKQGQAFKSRAQSMHVETFQSPWLCELMAFHINLREKEKRRKPVKLFDGCYPKFTDVKPSLTCELFDSVKLDIDLTCSNCLDTVFDPAALTCGLIFCYTCAYSAASVTIVDGLQGASLKEKCSLCRGAAVFEGAVHLDDALSSGAIAEVKESVSSLDSEHGLQTIEDILGAARMSTASTVELHQGYKGPF